MWIEKRTDGRRLREQTVQCLKGIPEVGRDERVALVEKTLFGCRTGSPCRPVRQHDPLVLRSVRGEAGAGDPKRWKIKDPSGKSPCREGDGEGGNLGAARVNFQTVEILTEDGPDGLLDGDGKVLVLLHPQADEDVETLDEEVAAATAGIENAKAEGTRRPPVKRPGGGAPGSRDSVPVLRLFPDEAEEVEVVAARCFEPDSLPKFVFAGSVLGQFRPLCEKPACPPSTHGVVEEEPHHVGLGEELGDGREFVGSDLSLARVYLVLPVGLPVLVGPAERIVRVEDRRRKARERLLQRPSCLGRKRDRERGIVGAEDLRQHRRGELAGERPGILLLPPCEFPAVIEGDRYPHLRLDQQTVLREEPGEQHTVPVLVGHLARQPGHFLLLPGAPVSELPPVRPQPPTKIPVGTSQGRIGLRFFHHERPECRTRSGLRCLPGLLHRVPECVAEFPIQRRHRSFLPAVLADQSSGVLFPGDSPRHTRSHASRSSFGLCSRASPRMTMPQKRLRSDTIRRAPQSRHVSSGDLPVSRR